MAERAAEGKPILKGEAEDSLHEMDIKRAVARDLIAAKDGSLWRIKELSGKGRPKALFPMGPGEESTSAAEMAQAGEPCPERTPEDTIAADHAQSGRQKYPTRNPAPGLENRDTLFPPPRGFSGQEDTPNSKEEMDRWTLDI